MDTGNQELSFAELMAMLEGRLEQNSCDVPPEPDDGYFPAAVMVLLTRANNTWNLVYTQRTNQVSDHKGQVSFPGGAWEDNDGCLKETALRETLEEVGISPEHIHVVGSLPPVKTVTGYYIVPFIGFIDWPYDFVLQKSEVESVFIYPLNWLADPTNRHEKEFNNPVDGKPRKALFYKDKDGHTLWGITAMLTVMLLDILY